MRPSRVPHIGQLATARFVRHHDRITSCTLRPTSCLEATSEPVVRPRYSRPPCLRCAPKNHVGAEDGSRVFRPMLGGGVEGSHANNVDVFGMSCQGLEIVWIRGQHGAGRFGVRDNESVDRGTAPRAASEQRRASGEGLG